MIGHAPDVGPDEHRPTPPAVDPRASGQRDQQERELGARGECADLERGRIERDDREQRDASWVTELPTSLTVWPVQSRTKFAVLEQSGSVSSRTSATRYGYRSD